MDTPIAERVKRHENMLARIIAVAVGAFVAVVCKLSTQATVIYAKAIRQ